MIDGTFMIDSSLVLLSSLEVYSLLYIGRNDSHLCVVINSVIGRTPSRTLIFRLAAKLKTMLIDFERKFLDIG